MKTIVVVQARCGSTRLPGKIMKKILGRTLLELQLERISAASTPNDIVVATTVLPEDEPVADICRKLGYNYIRGHPLNLLDRHYQAAKREKAGVVVKIPSDCPLIDPEIIDKVIGCYLKNSDRFDFVSNLHPATYPDGNDVEVMTIESLETAWKEATKPYETEHTTPFIWDNPERFRLGNVCWETGLDYSMTHRFTVDYPEDFDFIKSVFEALYTGKTIFSLKDILSLLENNPHLMDINRIYAGVNWYRHHTGSLKTIDKLMTKHTGNDYEL